MFYFVKFIITSLIIVTASELSKKYASVSAVLISLPVTSILTFFWIYYEKGSREKLITLSKDLSFLVLPSISFFIILAYLLEKNKSFYLSMACSMLGTFIFYYLFLKLRSFF